MTTLSVVIPSFNRGQVLLDTIELLLSQSRLAEQVIIVDQTDYQSSDPILARLEIMHESQQICFIRLPKPSIPGAMNAGLLNAASDYVLFLDDDVSFEADFLAEHYRSLTQNNGIAHVGQIVQPWQSVCELANYRSGSGITRDLHFPFHSSQSFDIANCMAGNLCVHRATAIEVGGFDQQYTGVAYRFETEFCRRLIRHSGELFRFTPRASLNHLKVPSGGTRDHAKSHLTSLSADHSVGDYYFALGQIHRSDQTASAMWYIFRRLSTCVLAKFYLRKPWYMPVRLASECMGLLKSIYLRIVGPRYIGSSD